MNVETNGTTINNANKNTGFSIVEEHDIEILPGIEINPISTHDTNISYDTFNDSDGSEVVCIYNKDKKTSSCEKREINGNSLENIEIKILEIEMLINTTTVQEVIFKKHNVEIIDKNTKSVIMEGIVCGYKLVRRSYDDYILLEFDDGRTFLNDNFGYLLRFYI
jgi:hypothetical protein